jgi:hypothetical protein
VVDKGFLPEDRAVGCEREYAQVSHAFESLIGPHIDKRLARRLHKRWLPPVTTPKPQRASAYEWPAAGTSGLPPDDLMPQRGTANAALS